MSTATVQLAPWEEAAQAQAKAAQPAAAAQRPQPAAPRPPDTISAAPAPGLFDRARQSIGNSLIGHSLQGAAPKLAEALHLQPTETEAEQQRTGDQDSLPRLPGWANAPIFPGADQPSVEAVAPDPAQEEAANERLKRLTQPLSSRVAAHPKLRTALDVAGGVGEGVSDIAAGLTSPANVALLAAAPELKPLSALFAAQAAKGSYDSAEDAYQAFRQGKNSEAAKLATESGLNAVIAGMAGRHALDGAFPVDTGRPAVSSPAVEGGQFEQPQLGAGPRPPVEVPQERPMLPAPADMPPWEEAARALPQSTAGEAPPNPQNPPPPVNPSTAVERTTPPPQFAPRPEPVPGRGMIVDPEGNVLPVRPALPPPRDTAGRKTPIIPKAVPAPIQTAPTPPQLTSSAVMAPAPPQTAPQPQQDGSRPVVQASAEPEQIQQSAEEQKPVLKSMADQAVDGVPGAKVEGVRVKDAESVENKDERGKPPETITDHLGARVSAPTPDAVEAIKRNVEGQLPVRAKDEIDSNGLKADQYAVQTGMPGEPNQQSELQVVTTDQAKAMKATDDLYAQQKEAVAKGDTAKADELGKHIAAKFADAQQPENQGRQALSESPDQVQLGNPAPAPLKPGDAVTYPANSGKMRPGKVVRIDGDNAYVRDGFTTIKKPLAKLQPVGGTPVKPGTEQASNQVAKQEVTPSSTGVTPQSGASEQGEDPTVKAGKWIGVDLDGTLAHYDGFKGPTVIGEPIAPMVDRVKGWLKEGKTVKILTARVSDDPTGETKRAIQDWIEKHIGQRLEVTDVKDSKMEALYDDRAVPVERNTGKLLAEPQPEGNNNANESRNGGESPAATAPSGERSKTDALQISSPEKLLQREPGEDRPEGGGRVQPGEQGEGPAGAGTGSEAKPLGGPGGGEKPEEVKERKYKHGNTQADIPADSPAGRALAALRAKIDPADLMGEGLVEDSHITVRYGIQGDDTSGIRAYLEKQAPFEARLGSVTSFPPSEHSDGAAPIVVAVGGSPDLRRMEKELDAHGDFAERSFPDYKPHVTVAYVKPEAAQKYTGNGALQGETFTVKSVSITDRDGGAEEVELKGKAAPSFYKPKTPQVAPMAGTAPPGAKAEERPVRTDQIGSSGKSNESSTVETKPKSGPGEAFKRAVQAKADKFLDEKVRWPDGTTASRREMIDKRTDAGWKAYSEVVPDDSEKRRLQREVEQMKKGHNGWGPPANENHPDRIKFNELKRKIADGPTKTEYFIGDSKGDDRVISKTEYEYATAKPVEKPASETQKAKKAKPEEKTPEQTAIEEHRAAHVPGEFARLVTEHGQWADNLVRLLKDPKADRKDIAEAAAKVDELAPQMERETGNAGGPVYAADFGYRTPATTEADAVAPGTATLTDHEDLVARLEQYKQAQSEAYKEMQRLQPFKGKKASAAEIEAARTRYKNLSDSVSRVEQDVRMERAATAAKARREAIPLTEPEEKIVTDPDQNKWKFQAEYFIKALEPVKQAWIDDSNGAWDWESLKSPKRAAWAENPTPEQRPKEFPNDFIRIEIPGDGKFLVKNAPPAIDKLLRSAPSAFAKPSTTVPGTAKAPIPRAPKELEAQRLIDHHQSQIDELEKDLRRAGDLQREYIQDQLKAARDSLADAKAAAKEQGGGSVSKAASPLGSTTYSGGFLDPELFKTLFPDIAERFKNWATSEITPGTEQREMMRQTRGERDRQVAAVSKKLQAARNSWTFRPRSESIKFFNAVESGDLNALDPKDRELAKVFQSGFKPLIEEIQELKPQALRSVIENYFPHIWEQPSMAAKTIRAVIAGRRPFAGSGSFLKQRTVPTMQDGLDMGLKPLSWNPVDLFLRKYAEMGQFLMAHKTLEMNKEAGTAKYVPVGTKAPEGWGQLDDRIGTVYGNPEIPVTEAFDKHVWNALMQTAQNILTATTRKTNIGGSRLGYYSRLDGIVTKANTQLSVLAHELGHAIDEVYGLKDQLVKHPAYAKELRALADLRIEDENGVSDYYKRYIRKGEEKMAAIFEAYVHAPERFEQVAPNLYKHIQDFIASKPELAPLRELKRGLTYQTRQNTVNAGGAVIRGHYYAPAEAAKVFNRYVSTGIRGRSAIYDTMRWLNDNMNSLQLGISAFHAATTSINAAVSEVAIAIQQMSQGKPVQALAHAASGFSVAPAVVRTMVNGSRMMSEYLDPGSYRKFAAEASAVAEAGGRAKMDVIQISAFRKTVNAFRNGAVGEGLLSLPGTMLQSTIAPVMDWMVPRMKLGAFYDMAHNIFDQADKHGWDEEAVRRRLQRAWDSVDNRFGQLVYENLFWHRALQDTLMLATRSVGWNFGDLRELGGGVADTAREAAGVFQGKVPEVTPRMAFAMALPLVTGLIGATLTYLWTGKGPETWKDYFYPKRQDGTRVSIPGYMKDVVSFTEHPVNTVTNKMSPLLEMTAEAINNRDFYGTEIRHKDDSYVKQLLQVARWAAGNTEPFAISGAQKLLAKEGEDTTFRWAHPLDSAGRIAKAALHHPGDVALGQLGFQPAPASIQNSNALNMAREYEQANAPSGTRTEAEAERARAMRMVQDMYRSGKVDRGEIQSLVKSGVLSERDRFHAQLESRTDPLVRAVRSLHPEQALNVYRSATPEEKKELRPVIEAKEREINNDVPRDQQETLKAAFRTTLRPQPKFQGPSA